MTTLADVATPAPIVDLDRMAANVRRMADYAARHGIALRPHTKTHKSPEVGALQLEHGASGLTCATLREAEVMATVADDVLLAYPPVGAAAITRLLALPAGTRVTVSADSWDVFAPLGDAARRVGRRVPVYVELDAGMRRVGVATPAEAVALARRVAAHPGLDYAGVMFYPGHLRGPVGPDDPQFAVLGACIDAFVTALADAGVAPRRVSGGSTPAAWQTHRLPHVNEMRPGTYVYNDRTTAAAGACGWDDCALTVLATVVSTAVPGQAVIDAGTKSLGREPLRAESGTDPGFGALLERPEVVVSRMSEEHGILDLSATDWRPRIGDRVRVVPNHVCIVTHLFDAVQGVRGETVERSWPVAARGR